MRHPFRETAELLRAMAAEHKRLAGKWWDEAYVARLLGEAQQLERLARVDQQP